MKNIFIIIVILFSSIILISCSIEESSTEPSNDFRINLIDTYNINVSEPSGLTYKPNTQTLWTVSDNDNKVYQLDLSGKVLDILQFTGNDLEGIAYDLTNNCFWVVEEEQRNLVKVSLNGMELERYEQIIQGHDNSGLEGICIDQYNNFYLLKEKNPSLFIELDSNFLPTESIELNFSDDISGISYDESRKSFWIVSDKSEKLFLWNKTEGVKFEFDLPADKLEGIYFIEQENKIYLVNDNENRLYYYELTDSRN